MTNVNKIKLNDFEIGGNLLTVLAGPCAIESKDILFKTAEEIKKNNTRLKH
jgi:3-deoxy-D-arabino-heptulosonate 7-phosphate (DAHP) synthase